jgi:hypothetical protein
MNTANAGSPTQQHRHSMPLSAHVPYPQMHQAPTACCRQQPGTCTPVRCNDHSAGVTWCAGDQCSTDPVVSAGAASHAVVTMQSTALTHSSGASCMAGMPFSTCMWNTCNSWCVAFNNPLHAQSGAVCTRTGMTFRPHHKISLQAKQLII